MGTVIPRSAGPDKIFEDFDDTVANGAHAGGDVKTAVDARLGPLQPTVAAARDDVAATTKAAADLEKDLTFVDNASDLEIASVLDEMWNTLGRPASSVDYTMVAGSGKAQWTDGDPRDQAPLMAILASRIRKATAPALQAGKDAWALRIDAKADPQQKAAAALKDAEVKVAVAEGIARAVADLAQVALTRLKRDLKNLGKTEAQVHEIIPDYVPKPRAPKAAKPAAQPAAPAAPAPAAPAEPKPV